MPTLASCRSSTTPSATTAKGISIETAVLPEGWESRLTTWDLRSSEPARPRFLDKYDLAVAKLAAHRPKDLEFVGALLEHGLLDADALRERARMLEPSVDPRTRESVGAAVESLARAARKRLGRSTTDDLDARDRFRSEHGALRERLDRGSGSVRTTLNEQGDSAESPHRASTDHERRKPDTKGPHPEVIPRNHPCSRCTMARASTARASARNSAERSVLGPWRRTPPGHKPMTKAGSS